jgi:D-beta-D-heptose 7-phosphate kinase / D-beta-D-heptose 1-phosphate adenosyltransferase
MWNKPKIVSYDELVNITNSINNKVIGVTTGCFDIFHSGHLKSIKYSKQKCDILILFLNSDASIKLLKGDNRPINKLEQRLELLAELPYIDYITVFDLPDVDSLIKNISFDILFKGGDYDIKYLQNKFPDAQIILSDYIKQSNGIANSTTNIIQKLTNTLHQYI